MTDTDTARRRIAIEQQIMDGWANLSGDHNPLHVSHDYASSTQFGGTIAHGHYSLALMEEMMLSVVGEAWRRGGTLQRVRFRSPVRPGNQYLLTVEGADGVWWLELRDATGGELAAEAEAVIDASEMGVDD